MKENYRCRQPHGGDVAACMAALREISTCVKKWFAEVGMERSYLQSSKAEPEASDAPRKRRMPGGRIALLSTITGPGISLDELDILVVFVADGKRGIEEEVGDEVSKRCCTVVLHVV